MKPTRARKACARAARACAKAYDALVAFNDVAPCPDSVADRHSHWLGELRRYTEYLEGATWPDKQG